MKFEIYEPKNIEEKKPIKLAFRKDSDGDLVMDCVNDFGARLCNLFYFNNFNGTFRASGYALDALKANGYDTSFLEWGEKGEIKIICSDD